MNIYVIVIKMSEHSIYKKNTKLHYTRVVATEIDGRDYMYRHSKDKGTINPFLVFSVHHQFFSTTEPRLHYSSYHLIPPNNHFSLSSIAKHQIQQSSQINASKFSKFDNPEKENGTKLTKLANFILKYCKSEIQKLNFRSVTTKRIWNRREGML